jgi:hypothetical protein
MTTENEIDGPFKAEDFELARRFSVKTNSHDSVTITPPIMAQIAQIANAHLHEIMKDSKTIQLCKISETRYEVPAPRMTPPTHTVQLAPWTIKKIK